MWRRVFSLPRTRLGWWAVGLSGLGLVFGRIFGIIQEGYGVGALITTALIMTLLITGLLGGGVVGAIALGAGERSLLVWVAQVPTALFFAFFTSFFLGQGGEGNYPLWVAPSLGVLFWALIALGIIYLMRSAQRNNVRWFE
jgi:hypothetical protein